MRPTAIITFTIFGPVLAYTDVSTNQAFFARHHIRSLTDDAADHLMYTDGALLWRRGRGPKLTPGKSAAAAAKAAAREGPTENTVAARLKATIANRAGSSPPSFVERQANKGTIQAAHDSEMTRASKSIADANRNAALIANRGQREPPRSPTQYKNLQDAKTRLRRAQKDALKDLDVTADALRKGPAMDISTNAKFSRSDDTVSKAHELAHKFGEAHYTARTSAVNENRWSDVADHIKKEQKSATRNNAIVGYHGALQMEQIDRRNRERLGGIRKARPINEPAIDAAIDYGIKSRKETNAAKDYYADSYARYLDSRRRFPDDSSSEDEERKFP